MKLRQIIETKLGRNRHTSASYRRHDIFARKGRKYIEVVTDKNNQFLFRVFDGRGVIKHQSKPYDAANIKDALINGWSDWVGFDTQQDIDLNSVIFTDTTATVHFQ